MVARMMKIVQDVYPEGNSHRHLVEALKEYHSREPFATGLDWNWQQLWALMTEEQCTMFCLKYPQYSNMFKEVP